MTTTCCGQWPQQSLCHRGWGMLCNNYSVQRGIPSGRIKTSSDNRTKGVSAHKAVLGFILCCLWTKLTSRAMIYWEGKSKGLWSMCIFLLWFSAESWIVSIHTPEAIREPFIGWNCKHCDTIKTSLCLFVWGPRSTKIEIFRPKADKKICSGNLCENSHYFCNFIQWCWCHIYRAIAKMFSIYI